MDIRDLIDTFRISDHNQKLHLLTLLHRDILECQNSIKQLLDRIHSIDTQKHVLINIMNICSSGVYQQHDIDQLVALSHQQSIYQSQTVPSGLATSDSDYCELEKQMNLILEEPVIKLSYSSAVGSKVSSPSVAPTVLPTLTTLPISDETRQVKVLAPQKGESFWTSHCCKCGAENHLSHNMLKEYSEFEELEILCPTCDSITAYIRYCDIAGCKQRSFGKTSFKSSEHLFYCKTQECRKIATSKDKCYVYRCTCMKLNRFPLNLLKTRKSGHKTPLVCLNIQCKRICGYIQMCVKSSCRKGFFNFDNELSDICINCFK